MSTETEINDALSALWLGKDFYFLLYFYVPVYLFIYSITNITVWFQWCGIRICYSQCSYDGLQIELKIGSYFSAPKADLIHRK